MTGIKLTGTYSNGCHTMSAVLLDDNFTTVSISSSSLQKCAELMDKALSGEETKVVELVSMNKQEVKK